MAHDRRYAHVLNPYFTVDQCRHPNCHERGEHLTLPDGTPDGPLCLEHMTDAGHCCRCWNFVAGSDDISMARCGLCIALQDLAARLLGAEPGPIAVSCVDIRGNKVRLGFDAPKELTVDRDEVYDEKREEMGLKPRFSRRDAYVAGKGSR